MNIKIFSLIILNNIFFVYFFNLIAKKINLYDFPNKKRKIHKTKIAPLGGFFILFNLVFYHILYYFNGPVENILFLIVSIIFFIIGFLDDKYDIQALKKFFLSIFIITFLLTVDNNILIKSLNISYINTTIEFNSFTGVLFSVFCITVFLNAFNFFDGINLQSGIYSLFIFSIFVFKSYNTNISISVIIGIIFFLYLNYKNLCFLGNGGSLLLGFIISYFCIDAYNKNIILVDEIFLIMLIPGTDLVRLFFLRIIQGYSPMTPDNHHLHHYLINRYNLIKTNIILGLLVIFPTLINLFLSANYTLYIIICNILCYFLLIYKLKKI